MKLAIVWKTFYSYEYVDPPGGHKLMCVVLGPTRQVGHLTVHIHQVDYDVVATFAFLPDPFHEGVTGAPGVEDRLLVISIFDDYKTSVIICGHRHVSLRVHV